jgi:DNA-binding PadR family transcriptional regulator
MTVRNSLLALLSTHPAHGYALKSGFEKHTAGAWPLNVGQVYTTLARLERDGLAEAHGAGDGEHRTWRLTAAGQAELARWFDTPVAEDPPARDELAIKVLLAVAAETVPVGDILRRQRVATLERLQQYTRLKARADPERELAWVLLLDALVLKAEAEVRWLDLCAERLARRDGR